MTQQIVTPNNTTTTRALPTHVEHLIDGRRRSSSVVSQSFSRRPGSRWEPSPLAVPTRSRPRSRRRDARSAPPPGRVTGSCAVARCCRWPTCSSADAISSSRGWRRRTASRWPRPASRSTSPSPNCATRPHSRSPTRDAAPRSPPACTGRHCASPRAWPPSSFPGTRRSYRSSLNERSPIALPKASSEPLSTPELAAWRGLLRTHAQLLRQLDRQLTDEHGLRTSSYPGARRYRLSRVNPAIAADAGQQDEASLAGEGESADPSATVLDPAMGQPRPWPRRRVVVQLRVAVERWLLGSVRDHGRGAISLIELDVARSTTWRPTGARSSS
jgi:hypothetical protein